MVVAVLPMGEDKSVDKQVSPAVQEALDLASKANALKEQIEAADASDSDDINAVIKHLLFCIEQHTLNCRQLISQISDTLAPGETSHYRRMRALEDLAQIDRLNEMLVLKFSQKLSDGRYDGMGTLTLHYGTDKTGIDRVLTFPNSRLKMDINKDKTITPIGYPDIAKHGYNVIESAFSRMANEGADVNSQSAKPLQADKPFFINWEE